MTAFAPAVAMRLALREGARGFGFVAPNPPVGCVIVDAAGRLLSSGYHRRDGGPHAEIEALDAISDRGRLQGARVYVTLEPCAHAGRTGSCARALAQLPIADVVYALDDPNPLVAGAGARMLREAGISARSLAECPEIAERFELIADAEDLAENFLCNMRTGRPFVSLKIATTLDGQMATVSGESKWITGELARLRGHGLRAAHDAVLIGRRTFELDDPGLDVRIPEFSGSRAAVLLDPSGRTLGALASSALLKARPPESIYVVVGPEAPASGAGATVLRVPLEAGGGFEVEALLAELWRAGLRSVLVEGGARTFAAFLGPSRPMAHRLHAFIAPMVLGSAHGLPWSAGFGFPSLGQALRLKRVKIEALGQDVHVTGRVDVLV